MGAPLRHGLLFCLFSFLFGCAAAFFAELLRALFSSLGLLEGKKKRISLRTVVGFFFYDVLLFSSLASLYMIFIYIANEGILRAYSLAVSIL